MSENERKREVVEIPLRPLTIEGMDVRKCVDETEGFSILEQIRDLLVYLTTLDIEGSEERSMKYRFGLEQAISGVEEAQEAASM